MNNIVEVHIGKVQKRFRKYLSLILKSKYNRAIADELIQTYIDVRYYNYGADNNIKFFYRRIYDALVNKAYKMIEKDKDKMQTIENTVIFFQYFFYFDYVRSNLEIEEVIGLIAEKRITRLKIRMSETDSFVKEFTKLVKEHIRETEENLYVYDDEVFSLDFRRVDPKKSKFYWVDLLYDIEFPEIFSKEAINEVFMTDIIAEDKLFVEYPMITSAALKDILVGNFSRIFIVDFAVDLLKKKKKIEQLLEVFENQAAQDKIFLRVKYNEFMENKEGIYSLMKRGFKFALVTNEVMKTLSNDELKILDVFSCIISNSNDVNIKKYDRKKLLIENI